MLGISLPRPWVARPVDKAAPERFGTYPETGAARHVGWFAARDHRDDGSAIAGLLIGLLVTLPVWALAIALLFLLLR